MLDAKILNGLPTNRFYKSSSRSFILTMI